MCVVDLSDVTVIFRIVLFAICKISVSADELCWCQSQPG